MAAGLTNGVPTIQATVFADTVVLRNEQFLLQSGPRAGRYLD
jgi:hypothetical protein